MVICLLEAEVDLRKFANVDGSNAALDDVQHRDRLTGGASNSLMVNRSRLSNKSLLAWFLYELGRTLLFLL